jgi:outer membrane protein TolC
MKKHLIPILSILLVIALPISATSYPSLDIKYEVDNEDEVVLDQESLKAFIQQWQDNSFPTFFESEKELRLALTEKNPDLEQLQSLYRMQQKQMQYQQSEQDFKVGLSSQPLYSISRSVSQSTTGGYDLSNTFGVGASVSKNLGTGAVATFSASQSSSLSKNSTSGQLWEWTHTPSASLTVNQPLWIGEGLIDSNYSKKQIEKLQISSENAKLSYDQLMANLVSQGNSQLSSLQALKESRFLLGEQLILEQESIKDAKKDLEAGRISRNDYEARVLGLNQLRYSLTEIEIQIETIQNSLATLWGSSDYPKQVVLDSELLEVLPSIIFDKEQLVEILLEKDFAYAQAIGKLRSAELDAILKSPSDAPMLNFSLKFSPSYTPSSGADFFTSYEDLFSSSTSLFSFSIGFSASDLSRSTTDLSSSFATESVLQAKLEVEKARDDLEIKVEEIQRNIKGLLLNLSIEQNKFEQRTNAIEVERIRFEIGLANEISIRDKEISWYDSAFMVLQTLRELDLIALDLSASGVEL